jgi:hypothetical protein
MILARDHKTGTLYMTTNSRDTIVIADTGVDSKLWHLRLGHMSKKGMKVLLSKEKLPELKSVESDLCEGCILRKQKKVSFAKVGRASKSGKLELVQTDLWVPTPVASLGGLRYYITFIDDSSTKDLGAVKQILQMRIIRHRANSTLKISQKEYVEKILRSENPVDVLTKNVTIDKLKLCSASIGLQA